MPNEVVIATVITEGGKLLSELLRWQMSKPGKTVVTTTNLPSFAEEESYVEAFFRQQNGGQPVKVPVGTLIETIQEEEPVKKKRTPKVINPETKPQGERVATSCVGCAIGHLATCSGLLKECVRFSDDMQSAEIIGRMNDCLDELNAMERVDLQPAKVVELPAWEQALAREAMKISRETRHAIEAGVENAQQLEQLSANLTNVRQDIGHKWLQQKMRNLSEDDKEAINKRVMDRIEKISNGTIEEEIKEK